MGAFSTSDCFNSWQKIRQEFEIWLLSILEPAKNTMTFQRLPSEALYRHWSILVSAAGSSPMGSTGSWGLPRGAAIFSCSPASVPGFLLWQGLQQRGTGVDYHLDGLLLEQHLQGHGFHCHREHAHREMNPRVCHGAVRGRSKKL